MSKTIIIDGLKNILYIIENKIYYNLKQVYLMSVSQDDLKQFVTKKLHIKYCAKLNSLKYKPVLSNNSYDKYVAENYKNVIKEIICHITYGNLHYN